MIDIHDFTSQLERARSAVSGGDGRLHDFVVVSEEVVNIIRCDSESCVENVVEVLKDESEVESGDSASGLADEVGIIAVQILKPVCEDVSIDSASGIDEGAEREEALMIDVKGFVHDIL